MAVTGTVTRGFTFSETTPITPSNLNSLGTPTVEIAGAVGTLSLDDGSITNAKVSATAAIDYSKLAALTGGNLLVGNGSNVATSVTMSGDCTMDNSGAVSIGEDKVTLAMIAAGTEGDVLYFGASGAPALLAKGTDGQVLKMNSGETAPEWVTDSSATAGTILGTSYYDTATVYTPTASYADIDATNVSVDFTAPASGNVLVKIECAVHSPGDNSILWLQLSDGSSGISNTSRTIAYHDDTSGGDYTFNRVSSTWKLTGLSGATTVTPQFKYSEYAGYKIYAGAFTTSGGADLDGGAILVEVIEL